MKGKVKSFSPEKKYGFIIPFGNPRDKDVFFHTSDVFGDCDFWEGDVVEFNVINSPRGQRAINVIMSIQKR